MHADYIFRPFCRGERMKTPSIMPPRNRKEWEGEIPFEDTNSPPCGGKIELVIGS